jgi:hypothetical protein
MEVHSHVAPEYQGWEISLIDPAFEHGHKSWGWFGADKLPVSTVSSWMTSSIPVETRKALYDAALKAANDLLAQLKRDS